MRVRRQVSSPLHYLQLYFIDQQRVLLHTAPRRRDGNNPPPMPVIKADPNSPPQLSLLTH